MSSALNMILFVWLKKKKNPKSKNPKSSNNQREEATKAPDEEEEVVFEVVLFASVLLRPVLLFFLRPLNHRHINITTNMRDKYFKHTVVTYPTFRETNGAALSEFIAEENQRKRNLSGVCCLYTFSLFNN